MWQLLGAWLLAASLCAAALGQPEHEFESVRTSNAAILNRLGLVPLTGGHEQQQRKRLADTEDEGNLVQPRSHPESHRHEPRSGHDSHVYVVKLPASPPYYSLTKPHGQPPVNASKPDPGFRSNGKPAKIFHWNLPLLKKLAERRKQMALLRLEQARHRMQLERERQKAQDKLDYLRKLAREQLGPVRSNDKWLQPPDYPEEDKASVRLEQLRHRQKKKKSAVSYYYAPKSSQGGISKHFEGNGRPKAFYVMDKSRKPVYYHPLLP